MKVILKESVEHLGTIGDVVKVSNGYARNFLIPRGLVEIANEGKVKQLDHIKRILEKKRIEQRADAEAFAQKLAEFSCTLKRKVGKGDKLFGSVTVADINKQLEDAKLQVPKGSIRLKEHIKTLGVHEVPIRLQTDVEATLKVWVVKDEE